MNSVWTEEEVKNNAEKIFGGEMTEEDWLEISYQWFKRQDNDDIETLNQLLKKILDDCVFASTKKLTFDAYSKRYQELSAVT